MGASVRPLSGDQIAENIQAMRTQGASDNDVEAYLRQEGIQPDRPAARPIAPQPDAPDPMQSYGMRLATHVLNAAQGIPGMRAVEAGAGALGSQFTSHPMGYRQALGQLDEMTGNIGGMTSAGEKVLGATPLLPWLPASPAIAGGLLGGGDQLLNADPDESLSDRAAKTAGAGVLGVAVGKGTDMAVTGATSLLAKRAAARVLDMEAARALSAKTLYGAAEAEGTGKEATPLLQKFLAEPDIAEIVGELQQTRPLKGVDAHDPRMLDAIYKTLSDRSAQVKKGLESISPNRPNIGRFRGRDVAQAQEQMLNALATPGEKTVPVGPFETAQSPAPDLRAAISDFWSRPGIAVARRQGTVEQQMARSALERHAAENVVSPSLTGQPTAHAMTVQTPPVMPTYVRAVQDFADRSKQIDAFKRGYQALADATAGGRMVSAKNLTRKTPEALAQWAATASPEERALARAGIQSGIKSSAGMPGKTFGPLRKASSAGASLLRSAGQPANPLSLLSVPIAFGASRGLLGP